MSPQKESTNAHCLLIKVCRLYTVYSYTNCIIKLQSIKIGFEIESSKLAIFLLIIFIMHFSSKSFPCSHASFSGASVTLDAPLIVPEQNRSFLATISLTEPSGGTTIPLEININDIGITASPFSMFNITAKYRHLYIYCFANYLPFYSHYLQVITYVWLHPLLCSKELIIQDVVCVQYSMMSLMTILLNLMRY